MADEQDTALPEGTDTVIEGASQTSESGSSGTSGGTITGTTTTDADRPAIGGGTGTANDQRGFADRIRDGRDQISSQAGERARGLVTQGLGRTSEALANVSKMVGDTAAGIEERLGPEYGDYARRAAGAIENVANNIAAKDPDELIEDTRNFVRNSPGIALAGAAVVGFVVARLVKSGMASGSSSEAGEA